MVTARDAASIYEVPLLLEHEGLDSEVAEALNIWSRAADISRWTDINDRIRHPSGEVKIAIVGKYVDLTESYKSLNEALEHGGIANRTRVTLHFIDSESLPAADDLDEVFAEVHGVLIPGGFGERGVEGKLQAIRHARTERIPCFGICLGMQLMAVEYARDALGLAEANSREFAPETPDPVVSLMADQEDVDEKGATMRLGAYPCELTPGSKAASIYGRASISERHRHRYEFNNAYRARLEEAGLRVCGTSPDDRLVEMIELPDHPWFIGCQFHPEFKSRPTEAHPLFASFIAACRARAEHDA